MLHLMEENKESEETSCQNKKIYILFIYKIKTQNSSPYKETNLNISFMCDQCGKSFQQKGNLHLNAVSIWSLILFL